MPIHAPKIGVLRNVTPKRGGRVNETKRVILEQKDVIERQNRSIGATCARDEDTKKERKTKKETFL